MNLYNAWDSPSLRVEWLSDRVCWHHTDTLIHNLIKEKKYPRCIHKCSNWVGREIAHLINTAGGVLSLHMEVCDWRTLGLNYFSDCDLWQVQRWQSVLWGRMVVGWSLRLPLPGVRGNGTHDCESAQAEAQWVSLSTSLFQGDLGGHPFSFSSGLTFDSQCMYPLEMPWAFSCLKSLCGIIPPRILLSTRILQMCVLCGIWDKIHLGLSHI